MEKITGKRIYLRGFEMSDKEIVLKGSNDRESARLTGTHATFIMPQIEAYIQRNQAGEDRAAWVICTLDDVVVGEVVINQIDSDNRSANIRIGLYDAQFFGQGYGTEAMRLAVDYGFRKLRLHRISLGVFDFNPRAIRVYEKIGFVREGVERDALFWEGRYHNQIMMSILEDEWAGILS